MTRPAFSGQTGERSRVSHVSRFSLRLAPLNVALLVAARRVPPFPTLRHQRRNDAEVTLRSEWRRGCIHLDCAHK